MAELDSNKLSRAVAEGAKEGLKTAGGELKDAVAPITDEIKAPFIALKAGLEQIPGVGVTKKLFKSISEPITNSLKGDATAKVTEAKKEGIARRLADNQTTLFENIRDTLKDQNSILLKGLGALGKGGLMGLGALAGLVAAPFAFLTSFFSQLAVELKLLGKIVGTGGRKLIGIFDPIIDLFKSIGKFTFDKIGGPKLLEGFNKGLKTRLDNLGKGFTKIDKVDDITKGVKGVTSYIGQLRNLFTGAQSTISKGGKFVKLDELTKFEKGLKSIGNTIRTVGTKIDDIVKAVGGVLTKVSNGAKLVGGVIRKFTILDQIEGVVKGLVNPVKNALTGIQTGAKTLEPFMQAFKPVISFAKTIGTVLGKIFLPITILMSAFDFVTGFMDGYDEGGVLGGLEGGITKLFQGLIGMPLDLLKSGVGYILGFFGFDNAKAKLDEFSFSDLIGDLVGSIFEGLKGVFGFLTDLFDFSDLSIFSVFSKLIDIVFLPVNLAINFIKDLFGFSSDDQEPFSLGKFIMGVVQDLIDFFLGFFNIDVGAIVDALPGPAKTILKKLGILDETDAEKAASIQEEIAEAQARIAKFDAGENAYFGLDTQAKRDEDAAMIAEMQQELEMLKTQGGGNTTNNFITNDNKSYSQSTTNNSTSFQDPSVATNSGVG